jgi:hypothetical protein
MNEIPEEIQEQNFLHPSQLFQSTIYICISLLYRQSLRPVDW